MNRVLPFPSFLRTPAAPRGVTLGTPPRVLFHHQPKTAGSTFRGILARLFRPGEVCPAEIEDELRALRPAERRRYRLYAGHFSYATIESLFDTAVWLVLLRHPVERVISNFYNLRDPRRYGAAWERRVRERPDVARFLAKVEKLSLEEFVHCDDPRALDRVVNRQARYLVAEAPGTKRYPVCDAALLDQARRNLTERFAWVGVQEHFDVSLQLFCMTFGLLPLRDVDRFTTNVNTDERRADRYEVPDRVLRAIEERNPMDLELWRLAETLLWERHAFFSDVLAEQEYERRREGAAGGGAPASWLEDLLPPAGRSAAGRRLPVRLRRLLGRALRR